MADRKPLKVLPDSASGSGGGDSTGLGEFVEADTIGVVDGGTGLATVGSNQLLTGNGTSALTSESNLTFDGTSTLEVRGPAANFGVLTLSTAETTIVNTDPLGRIDFKAPLETGTNAVLSTARIEARATETFDATHNQTDLLFMLANDGGVTEKLRLKSDGDLTISDGDLVIGTSGHGISFAATSNGGTTTPSELFDDYEEGTWTPSMRYGSSDTAYTHTNQEGRYVKIGRLVWISANMNISNADASNSGSDGLKLYGLPFTITNETAAHSRIILHINKFNPGSTALELFAYAIVNTTILQPFLTWNNGNGWSAPTTDMFYRADGAQNVFVTGCYFANA